MVKVAVADQSLGKPEGQIALTLNLYGVPCVNPVTVYGFVLAV